MKTLRGIALLAGLSLSASVALASDCPGPDGGNYQCVINPAGAGFVAPMTSANLVVCDDCNTLRAIGFTYNHYGVSSTQVQVSSNGYLTIGPTGNNNFAGGCNWPTGSNPGYIGRYRDLYPVGGGFVRDGVVGVGPNRVYAVEWNNVPPFSGAGNTTFQIQLHENAGAGQMARIVVTLLGVDNGDVGHQNIAMTQGIRYLPCNQGGLGVPWTIQFSQAPPPSGGCDLRPIEAKLDDGTRFTSDAERNTQTTTITNNIVNALNPGITRLEGKLDDGSRFTSDAERTAQTTQLVNEINQNETKIDRLESKLDDERRFTDDSELAAVQQSIDAIEAKDDQLQLDLSLQLQIEMEHALGEDTNVNKPLAIFMLPAPGGRLEEIRDLVDRTINNIEAAGCNAGAARSDWNAGNAHYAMGHWELAYVDYAHAYQTSVMGPCNP